VLSLESRVIQVKDVPSGARIGYGGAWEARRPSRIATLPVGYADGLPRAVSLAGHVLFDGGPAPYCGRISMDMAMVDVTDLPPVDVGTPVTLLGERAGRAIGVREVADAVGTIPYEVLCRVGQRVPRVYVEDGAVVGLRLPLPGREASA
jgi:alanine racemase